MCYSAQILADYRRYIRLFGADISIREFVDLFWLRAQGAKIQIPKAVEAAFDEPVSKAEHEIKSLINRFAGEQETRFQQELCKQRARLVEAERKLASRPTKAAAESRRIAGEKIEWLVGSSPTSAVLNPRTMTRGSFRVTTRR
jgi:hypothetical protein